MRRPSLTRRAGAEVVRLRGRSPLYGDISARQAAAGLARSPPCWAAARPLNAGPAWADLVATGSFMGRAAPGCSPRRALARLRILIGFSAWQPAHTPRGAVEGLAPSRCPMEAAAMDVLLASGRAWRRRLRPRSGGPRASLGLGADHRQRLTVGQRVFSEAAAASMAAIRSGVISPAFSSIRWSHSAPRRPCARRPPRHPRRATCRSRRREAVHEPLLRDLPAACRGRRSAPRSWRR